MYELTREDRVWAKNTGFECHSPHGVLNATLKYAGWNENFTSDTWVGPDCHRVTRDVFNSSCWKDRDPDSHVRGYAEIFRSIGCDKEAVLVALAWLSVPRDVVLMHSIG